MLLTRSPLEYPRRGLSARLACVKHAASVRPEPGSNSPTKTCQKNPGNKQCCQKEPHPGTSTRTPRNEDQNNWHWLLQHPVEFSNNKHTPPADPNRRDQPTGQVYRLTCTVESVRILRLPNTRHRSSPVFGREKQAGQSVRSRVRLPDPFALPKFDATPPDSSRQTASSHVEFHVGECPPSSARCPATGRATACSAKTSPIFHRSQGRAATPRSRCSPRQAVTTNPRPGGASHFTDFADLTVRGDLTHSRNAVAAQRGAARDDRPGGRGFRAVVAPHRTGPCSPH